MSRILIVEDNEAVALGLRYALVKEGFEVDHAARAANAESLAINSDLIVLDIRLPDGDGFELCRRFRAAGLHQPILMLTARDELIDKVIGLEVGADDYMTKPFELREVTARIRALLRRAYGPLASTGARDDIVVGPIVIDHAGQSVKRDGREIHLTGTEFRLLAYLARHPNRACGRHDLLAEVWGYEEFVGDLRTVDVHIRNLRQKLEDDPGRPSLLVTVRGSGYKLVVPG